MKINNEKQNSRSRRPGFGVKSNKKAIFAACLLIIMAVMWVRVLSGVSGKSEASVVDQNSVQANGREEQQIKVTYIDLPKVEGRNDVLTRDFFVLDRKELEHSASVEGNRIDPTVVSKIKLEAVSVGKSSYAFINGKLLKVGDSFLIDEGKNVYEFFVTSVEQSRVLLKCKGVEIELKITDFLDVAG